MGNSSEISENLPEIWIRYRACYGKEDILQRAPPIRIGMEFEYER
jgi:hypothetical protein